MAATPTVIVEAPRRSRRGREVVGGSAADGHTNGRRISFGHDGVALHTDRVEIENKLLPTNHLIGTKVLVLGGSGNRA